MAPCHTTMHSTPTLHTPMHRCPQSSPNGLPVQPRLSSVVALDLSIVCTLLCTEHLDSSPNRRLMAQGDDLEFSSRAAFRLLSLCGCIDQASIDIGTLVSPRRSRSLARCGHGSAQHSRELARPKLCPLAHMCIQLHGPICCTNTGKE